MLTKSAALNEAAPASTALVRSSILARRRQAAARVRINGFLD
jgi:hypothetical protein